MQAQLFDATPNAYKALKLNASNEDFFVEFRECKSEVRVWGGANQISVNGNK